MNYAVDQYLGIFRIMFLWLFLSMSFDEYLYLFLLDIYLGMDYWIRGYVLVQI